MTRTTYVTAEQTAVLVEADAAAGSPPSKILSMGGQTYGPISDEVSISQ